MTMMIIVTDLKKLTNLNMSFAYFNYKYIDIIFINYYYIVI